jgi:hypothetical protein
MARYEIFQKLRHNQPTFVESARSLADAKKRLRELKKMFPDDYFIFDTKSECIVIPYDRSFGKLRFKPQ